MTQAWSPEQVVDVELAKSLIEAQFKELAPVTLHVLGEGFDNTVFQVNSTYVFRFPRREIAVGLIKTENRILPNIAGILPLPIPQPVYFGAPCKEYRWPFTGYKIVHGETPKRLTVEQRHQFAEPLAEFLKALHQFPVQQAIELGVETDKLYRIDIGKRKERLLGFVENILSKGLFSEEESLLTFVNKLEKIDYESKLALVHGDLHLRNILVDAQGVLTGIIDWGDTHIGNPAIDLSIVYSLLPVDSRKEFFRIYGEIDQQTEDLARFKAVYTTTHLLLYAHDKHDKELMDFARKSILLALQTEEGETIF